MIDLKMRVDGDFSPEAIIEACGLQDHGPVQQAIDTAIIKYMEPYWAWDTGALAKSAYTATDIGSGLIVYDKDYAYDMYYGVRADGTRVNYHLDKNPMAGPFPFERMIADHLNDILEEANAVAGGK